MAKKLKKPKQLELPRTKGWGGKRARAGRPNRTLTINHMKRERVSLKTPLHLTLKLKEKLPTLRNKVLFREFKEGLKKARLRGLYVIHFSVQSDHIHLFAEAENNKSLALGMRSLAGRFAKKLRHYAHKNESAKKKGFVFKGRYFMRLLRTPTEVKNALEYVLLNRAKHEKLIAYIDPFSSGSAFQHWKKLLGSSFNTLVKQSAHFHRIHKTLDQWSETLSPPRSWLARQGWFAGLKSV